MLGEAGTMLQAVQHQAPGLLYPTLHPVRPMNGAFGQIATMVLIAIGLRPIISQPPAAMDAMRRNGYTPMALQQVRQPSIGRQ